MASTTTTITTTTTTTTIATGEPRDETAEGEDQDQDQDQGEREGEDEEDRDLPDPGACVGPKMEDAGGKPAAAPAAAAAAAGGPGPGPGPEAGPEAADGSEEPPGPPGSPGDRPPTVRPVKEEEPRREEGGRSPDLDGDSDHKHGGGGGGGGGGEGRGDGDGDGGGGGGGGRGDGGGGGGGELSDKRRTSVEVSSSDGEPLSRMDSEDSISSTLMEMESTVSSGRSTPAMMNGQGSAGGGGGGGGGPAVAKTAYPCCWDLCLDCFNSSPDLAEHIRGLHVDGQRGGVFVCLWKGCKVYNTPSTSQSWLHRHMLTHSGDKPFKCVVGGCTASFASQGGLARHVPSHFSQQSAAKLASQARLKEESPSKAGLNKRKKLKNKRRRSLPRPHDFFDAQTMDAIRHRAICLNLATHIESVGNGHSVVFHSTVLARRKEGSGKVKVLLHWTPEDILPDVWVNETERSQLKTKVVHLSQLPADTAMLLDPNIYRALPQKRLKQSL